MKKLLFVSIIVFTTSTLFAQQKERTLPSINLTDLEGNTVNTKDFSNDGKPIVINFWATWCSPCKRELNNIADMYDDWQEETGVKIIAISIDDSRGAGRVAPYVNGKAWDFEVYLDINSDLKRAIGFQNVPYTMILNAEGTVVYSHTGYQEGDEYALYEAIKLVAAGKPVVKSKEH